MSASTVVCLTEASLEGQVTVHNTPIAGGVCLQAGCPDCRMLLLYFSCSRIISYLWFENCRNNNPASTLPSTFKCVTSVQQMSHSCCQLVLFASLLFHLSATPACMHNHPLLPLLYALASVCITQKNHAKYVSIYQAYICLKAKHIHACMLA